MMKRKMTSCHDLGKGEEEGGVFCFLFFLTEDSGRCKLLSLFLLSLFKVIMCFGAVGHSWKKLYV